MSSSTSRNWTKIPIFQKCQSGSQGTSTPCFIRPYDSFEAYKDTRETKPYTPAFEVTTTGKSGRTGKVITCSSHLPKIYGMKDLIRQHKQGTPEDPNTLGEYISSEGLVWPLVSSPREPWPSMNKESRQYFSDAKTTLKAFNRPLEVSAVTLAEADVMKASITTGEKRIYAETIRLWANARSIPTPLIDNIFTFCPSIKNEIPLDQSLWDEGYAYRSKQNGRVYTPRQKKEMLKKRKPTDASALASGSDLLLHSNNIAGDEEEANIESDDEAYSTLAHSIDSFLD